MQKDIFIENVIKKKIFMTDLEEKTFTLSLFKPNHTKDGFYSISQLFSFIPIELCK